MRIAMIPAFKRSAIFTPVRYRGRGNTPKAPLILDVFGDEASAYFATKSAVTVFLLTLLTI